MIRKREYEIIKKMNLLCKLLSVRNSKRCQKKRAREEFTFLFDVLFQEEVRPFT